MLQFLVRAFNPKTSSTQQRFQTVTRAENTMHSNGSLPQVHLVRDELKIVFL